MHARLTALPRHLDRFPSHKNKVQGQDTRTGLAQGPAAVAKIQPHLSEDVHNRGVAAANNPFRAGLSTVLAVFSGVVPCLLPGTARRSHVLHALSLLSLRSQMKAGKMKLVGTTLQPDLRKVDPV